MKHGLNLWLGLLLAVVWGYGQRAPSNFRYVDDEGQVQEVGPDSVKLNAMRARSSSSWQPSHVSSSSSAVVVDSSEILVDVPSVPPLNSDSVPTEPETAAIPMLEQIPEDILPVVADPAKMSRDELFQLAFKKPPAPRSRDFMAVLYVDGMNMGDVQILYDSSFSQFNFYSMPFSYYLDTLLTPEARKRSNGKDGHYNSHRMDSLGFAVDLDERNYVLKVYVPSEMKQLQKTFLGRREEPRGLLLEPAFLSAYLNMHPGQYVRCSELLGLGSSDTTEIYDGGPQCGRDPLVLDLDGAIAFRHWILEGSGKVTEPDDSQKFGRNNARRNDFRLIREYLSSGIRVSLGDIGGATEGMMQPDPLGGIRYEYSPRFFGHNIFQDRYKIRFLLPRPAQVEVLVDGKVVHRLRLPSGSHELSGFSGRRGMNVIQVFMTQEDGSFVAIPYSFELGDSRNLLQGEAHYSVSGGVQRVSNPVGYDYHVAMPGMNGQWLYGIAPTLTGGLFGQSSRRNAMVGGQCIWSPDSSFWWEIRGLVNYADSSGSGSRQEIEYGQKLSLVTLSVAGSHQSRNYDPHLFGMGLTNKERYGMTGVASMPIPRGGLSVFVGASLNRHLDDVEYSAMDYNYGANVSQNINGLSLNLNASATVNQHVLEPFVSINAGYVFGVGKHNFIITDEVARRPVYVASTYSLVEDSSANSASNFSEPSVEVIPGYTKYEWDNSASVGWNWSDGGSINGARSYTASLTTQDDFSYGRLWAQHHYNRVKIGASYNLMDFDASYITQRFHSVYANMGSSFMFADGVWAFGRPVDKGFIVAKPQNGLTGSSVHINHSEFYDADFSQSGWLGAAYYNQISNYRPNEIQISLTDVPMGSWLEQDRYYTMGAYKQGYAVRLGSAARVLMRVRLIDETKQPMDYVYVTVGEIDADSNMLEKRATFTSKDGVLQMGNLHPGHTYKIHFGTDSYIKDIIVKIPRGSGSLFTLPDIQVEHKQLDMSMSRRSQASLGKPQTAPNTIPQPAVSNPAVQTQPAPAPSVTESPVETAPQAEVPSSQTY